MPSALSDYQTKVAAAHRARRLRLQQAVDLATQLEATLRDIEPRYATRCAPTKDDADQRVLDEIYVLEDALQERMRAVNEQRNMALSPSSRLNDDVLQLVFREVCLYTEASALMQWSQENITLSRVCRRWRTVALETAPLWSVVRFGIWQGSLTPNNHPWGTDELQAPRLNFSEKVEAFLERSKGSALRTTLNLISVSPALGFVMDAYIDKCSDRAESLSVVMPTQELANFLDCLSCVSRVLKHLDIHMVQDEDISMDDLKRFFQLPMPSLLSANLRDVQIPSSFEPGFVGLSSVRVLDLVLQEEHFTASTFTVVLQCCPDLEDLTVGGDVGMGVPPENAAQPPKAVDRVLMERLKSYCINLEHNLFLIACSTVLAPNLVVLDLRVILSPFVHPDPYSQHDFDVSTDAICAFLKGSLPMLKELNLDGVPAPFCASILALTPTIQTLSYSQWWSYTAGPTYWHSLEKGLMCSSSSPNEVLCPFLQNLKYRGCYAELELRIFLQLIMERICHNVPGCDHVLPLRRLELCDVMKQSELGREMEEAIGLFTEEFVIMDWKYDKQNKEWVERVKQVLH